MPKHVHIIYFFHVLYLYHNRAAVKKTLKFGDYNYDVVLFFTGIFTPENL